MAFKFSSEGYSLIIWPVNAVAERISRVSRLPRRQCRRLELGQVGMWIGVEFGFAEDRHSTLTWMQRQLLLRWQEVGNSRQIDENVRGSASTFLGIFNGIE